MRKMYEILSELVGGIFKDVSYILLFLLLANFECLKRGALEDLDASQMKIWKNIVGDVFGNIPFCEVTTKDLKGYIRSLFHWIPALIKNRNITIVSQDEHELFVRIVLNNVSWDDNRKPSIIHEHSDYLPFLASCDYLEEYRRKFGVFDIKCYEQ